MWSNVLALLILVASARYIVWYNNNGRFSIATKLAMSNFNFSFSFSSSGSLLKARAIGAQPEGPRPTDLACFFFRSDIEWVCWSFWTWSRMLLSLTESAKVFAPSDFFYKITAHFTLQLDYHLLPSLFLARAVQPSHLSGTRDRDYAATSGK